MGLGPLHGTGWMRAVTWRVRPPEPGGPWKTAAAWPDDAAGAASAKLAELIREAAVQPPSIQPSFPRTPVKRRLRAAAVATLAAIAAAGCGDLAGPGERGAEASLALVADVSGTPINTLVVEVTAPDIGRLVFNLPVQNGIAGGTLKMPAGSGRTITVQAFDAGGTVTHTGSVTLNVNAGQNPPVSLPITSNSGHVPVTVTLADHVVVVSPAQATVAAGGTAQLGAVVIASTGDTLDVDVTWATLNPSRATVSQTGVVTGVAAGAVQIVATYAGVGAASQVTVQ